MNNDSVSQTTSLWEMYQNGVAYQASIGLTKDLPRYVRFYEGDQWAAPTKATKNLPRPVINIIKMICRNKKAAILSAPVKLVYQSDDMSVDMDKFNRFVAFLMKEMRQEDCDKIAIDDAVKKGTYVYHYYWDADAKGKDGVHEGALRCEVIDPLNVFFANPAESDEQKQKWILFVSREEVSSVKAKADDDADKDAIVADEYDEAYDTVEQEGDKLCTVLTRYFRKDGEVYCEKATKSVVINKPFAIAPDLASAAKELGMVDEVEDIDAPNNDLPDKANAKTVIPKTAKAPLYPVVVGNYERREKSIYGIGEVKGLIANQKSINFLYAMMILNAQEVAWGKYIALPSALRGQTITNEPGQVLVDYSKTGSGIRKMTEQTMQTAPLTILESLMQTTRTVAGASEVMTGEVVKSSMSGAAIAQLQSQAQMPIAELRDSYWLVKEKQGKVIAQFAKLYYEQEPFSYEDEIPAPENVNTDIARGAEPNLERVSLSDSFSSSEYSNADFTVVVEATAGAKATAASDITMLDTLFQSGKISLKTYINAYPDDSISNKSAILKGIEEDRRDALTQAQAQLQQYEKQLQQYQQIVEKQAKTVDNVTSILQENAKLKETVAGLYREATQKIRQGNAAYVAEHQKALEATEDATIMSEHIYNNEFTNGSNQA